MPTLSARFNRISLALRVFCIAIILSGCDVIVVADNRLALSKAVFYKQRADFDVAAYQAALNVRFVKGASLQDFLDFAHSLEMQCEVPHPQKHTCRAFMVGTMCFSAYMNLDVFIDDSSQIQKITATKEFVDC